MQTTEIAEKMLPMYLGTEVKYGKDYSFISERRQLELLKERRGYEKSRASLGRYKKRLDDEKYVMRIQRFKKHPIYGMQFKSTVIYITVRGLHWLRRAGYDVTDKIYRALIRMKKKQPGAPPQTLKKVLPTAPLNKEGKPITGRFWNPIDGDELEKIGTEAYLRRTNR